jgi:hypothetical protein
MGINSRRSLDAKLINVNGTEYITFPNGFAGSGNTIEINGYGVFSELTTDTSTLSIPSEYEQVIVYGACAGILTSIGNTLAVTERKEILERAKDYENKFEVLKIQKGRVLDVPRLRKVV